MTKKMIGGLAALALVVALAPSVQATCSPGKAFGTWDFDDVAYYYIYNFSGDYGTAVGAFWEPGNRSVSNEGSYNIDNYLRFYAGTTNKWYITGNLGDDRVNGCPAGQMVLSMTDGANYAIGIENETPAKGNAYNFANLTFAEIPRPRIVNSLRTGTGISGDLDVDAIAVASRSGLSDTDAVSGLTLYTFSGTADPGRDAAAWTPVETLAYAGGTTRAAYTADCTDEAVDVYLAIGIQLTNEYEQAAVSASTVIECDPALADPGDKFQIIRERGKGEKKGKPFQQDTSVEEGRKPGRSR